MMEPLTLTDAKNEMTVAKTLAGALVSGSARPVVTFSGSHATITARVQGDGRWMVSGTFGACYVGKDSQTPNLSTEQAVACIVSLARTN